MAGAKPVGNRSPTPLQSNPPQGSKAMSYSLNRCNLPPWIVASREFNEAPEPISIQGVHASNQFLFRGLDEIASQAQRAEFFNDYMSVKFHLHQWEEQRSTQARRAIKNSYRRFIRGWGADSNSVEGAVLKGWVESRIGIPPIYHRERLPTVRYDDYTPYALDRMKGSARTNDINGQLDLLYAYTQYELGRTWGNHRWLRLFRGTYDADEHDVVERVSRREYFVRLNNLCSFTTDKERAWEFGNTVWSVSVPLCKVFFYGDLLPQSILKGENEHLVIGGEFRVKEVLY